MKNLDAKLLVLVSATLIAGLFAGRSILSAGEPSGDRGFGGVEPLPLGGQTDDTPALVFDVPTNPRNPFADGRELSGLVSDLDSSDLTGEEDGVDPAADTSFEG